MDKFERYWKLSEMEERYNASSGGVRTLASAWLLATLGATGWLFSAFDATKWPLPLGLLVVAVLTLGALGLVTLWVLDLLVFHRLLSSVFVVGLKLEWDDAELPPLRSMMMKSQEGLGTHRWERLFYLAPVVVFAVLSAAVTAAGSDRLFAPNPAYFDADLRGIAVALFVMQVLAVAGVLTKMRSMATPAYAKHFGDARFLALVEQRGYEVTIARSRAAGPRAAADAPPAP